MAVVNFI